MNEAPLKVWILASMDGNIRCAHCNCVAGLSETCSHVAAICFAVANIGESREVQSSNGNFKLNGKDIFEFRRR